MDRWHDQFQEFLNSNSWKSINEFAKNINIENIDDDTHKSELSRFKRIVKHLDTAFNSIEPHYLDLVTLDEIIDATTNCVNQLNGNNIESANDFLSIALKKVLPFTTAILINKDASTAAFKEYNKLVSDSLPSKKKELRDVTKSIKNALNLIISIENESGAMDENSTTEKKLEAFFEKIKNQKEEIEKSYKEAVTNDDSITTKLNQTKIDAEKILDEIKQAFEKHEKYHDELIDYHDLVFGYEKDDGTEVEGLRDTIENSFANLKDYHIEQANQHKSLKEEIESLLPGATSVGLSVAYNDLKDKAAESAGKYTNYFIWVIITLIVTLGIFFFGYPIRETSFEAWIVTYLNRLPIITSLIWLGYFFAKRRSEQERLKQEYAHKESLSRSYESYRKQINDLGEKESDLLPHLIKTAIDTIGYNAAKTLDKRHSGDYPTIIDSKTSDKS